jgi:glutaredoxin 3
MEDRNVTIYTTPSCGFCQQAKRFLREHGVEYREVDVSTDQAAAKELVLRSRQFGVPVIDVGGTLVIGFDVRRLEKLLHAA